MLFSVQVDFSADGQSKHVTGSERVGTFNTCPMAAQEDNLANPLHGLLVVILLFQYPHPLESHHQWNKCLYRWQGIQIKGTFWCSFIKTEFHSDIP